MNREDLKALGLDDEQVENVLKSHGKTITKVKDEFAEVKAEADSLKTQLEERDTQLGSLRDQSQGNAELQATIDALRADNEASKEVHQSELNKTKLHYELDQALLLNKAINPRAVRALLDTQTVTLNEEGHIEGLESQLEAVKQSDPYLFQKEDTTPPPTGYTPGAGNKHNTPPKPDGYNVGVAMYEQLKTNKRI